MFTRSYAVCLSNQNYKVNPLHLILCSFVLSSTEVHSTIGEKKLGFLMTVDLLKAEH